MAPDPLRDRIADQFSYRGERADVWRAFDLVLDTDAFLNLGFSAWYQSHAVGSSQRRLVTRVGEALAANLPRTAGTSLLDVGCGRGGPSIHLAERFGFDVTGLDLVPYNVRRASVNARRTRANARPPTGTEEGRGSAAFVVGDATQLPFRAGSFAACTAVDALVYLPDRAAVFAELAAALEPGGVLVFSDLLARPATSDAERQAVAAFADAWDMPPPGTVADYRRALDEAGFTAVEAVNLTPHSVGRFRTWTTLYRWLSASPIGPLIEQLLRTYGLDPSVIDEQVRRAHEALPALRHRLFVAET